jgi:hypoxanthine phosphoribosyltransferase
MRSGFTTFAVKFLYMRAVNLHGREFELFIKESDIQEKVRGLAEELSKTYADKEPLFIGILNGCFRFTSDLMKYIEFNSEVNFVKLASYRGMVSSQKVKDLASLNTDLRGKHVIVLEDIVDTGNTLDYLLHQLEAQRPASLKVASLLFKPDAFLGSRKPDYHLFDIPNAFVVGYGLDFDGLGRNLNDIYQLKSK